MYPVGFFDLLILAVVPAFTLPEGCAVSFLQEIKVVAAANAMMQKEIIVFFMRNDFYDKKNV